jgi:hypothetical protein
MNRRRFLLLTMVSTLAARGWAEGTAAGLPDWLARLAFDPAACAGLGEAYLAEHPDERDPRYLLGVLEQSIGHGDTLASLDRTVRAEYLKGDFVQLRHWILSPTEARLYALFAAAQAKRISPGEG